ncbi:hypothetical protein N2152v2_008731 [Parachlorella kessleri]
MRRITKPAWLAPPRKRGRFAAWLVFLLATVVVLPEVLRPAGKQHSNDSRSQPELASGSGPAYLTAQQRCRGPNSTESVPRLEVVESWAAYQPTPPQQVTLVTQVNLARQRLGKCRLDMLVSQCRSWPLALVAAAYAPQLGAGQEEAAAQHNVTSLADARQQLAELHHQLRQEGKSPDTTSPYGNCNLHLRLYTEVCTLDSLHQFPANALRNRALQMAETEIAVPAALRHAWEGGKEAAATAAAASVVASLSDSQAARQAVLLLDVDFIVSRDFGAELGTPAGWEDVRLHLGVAPAIVVPAFQAKLGELAWNAKGVVQPERLAWGKQLAFDAVAGGKRWVADNLQRGAGLAEFNWGTCARRATNVSRWLQSKDYYRIEYEKNFEPDVIMLRQHVPWYDERFRGYGLNKAIEFSAMHSWGVTFLVHPRGFVVHVAHPWSDNQQHSKSTGKLKSNFASFESIYATEVLENRFYPVTAFADSCPLTMGA